MSKTIDQAALLRLAANFAAILATRLPRNTITACEEAQKDAPEGVCVLHDVCDANEHMLQALAMTFPDDCKPDGTYDHALVDDDVGRLIDAAWPLGRHILFSKAEVKRLQATVAHAQAATRNMHELARSLSEKTAAEGLGEALASGLARLRDDLSNANVPETTALQRTRYPQRADEAIDWSKPLFDSSGYEHSLVHLGAIEAVTKQGACYCVWRRRDGACRISDCEDITLSNTPLSDDERSAIHAKGMALYEDMRAAATPRG